MKLSGKSLYIENGYNCVETKTSLISEGIN